MESYLDPLWIPVAQWVGITRPLRRSESPRHSRVGLSSRRYLSLFIGRAGLVALDPAVSEDKGVATMATSHALNPVTI